MRHELARQMKSRDQLVKIEDENDRFHDQNCPVKVNYNANCWVNDKCIQVQERLQFLHPFPSLVTDTAEPPFLLPFQASDIERYARIIFPLLFITFHLVYWTLLAKITELHLDDLVPLKTKAQ